MNQPSLDELMKKVDSRYTLVVVAAKRARQLTEDEGVKVADEKVRKPVSVALLEVVQGTTKYCSARLGIK